MKCGIIVFILFCIGLVFTMPAMSQQQYPQYEQERAAVLAEEIARQKESGNSGQDNARDSAALVDEAYAHWAKNEFSLALDKFQAAWQLDQDNENLKKLMYDVERDRLGVEQRQTAKEQDLLQERRKLELQRAWLVEDPSRQTHAAVAPRRAPESLQEKAQRIIVSLDFDDAQVSVVLGFLSTSSDINIVMDEAALASSGTLSIHLRNVSVAQALESSLRTKGLTYRFENDFVWVSTPEGIAREGLTTRIYHLSQGLATFTKFSTFDTVTIDAIRGDNDLIVMKDDEVGAAGSLGKGVHTVEGVRIGGPGGVAGKVTRTIEDVLRAIVDWPNGSRIFLDHRTSTLIVRNTPSNLGIIEQAIAVLDVNPPQVMIEARFVEVGAADLLDMGLKLSGQVSATGARQMHTFPFIKDQATDYTVPMISQAATPFDVTLGTLDFSQFQAVLSAIEEKSDTNTLSSPKITTVGGQEAIIKVVKEYRYPTKYDIVTFEIGTGDNRQTVVNSVPAEFKTRDIGIILRVTPNVGADSKTINMTMIPEVSEFDINEDMYNYGTEEQPFKQPFFSVRNCTASIVVNNGDTVVLGGLMRETVQQTVSRVPLLGQVPLLGKLFTYKHDNKQKRNLLIFVTARLITPSGQSVEDGALARVP